MDAVRYVEGVPYYRFRVRFRLADGRVRRWVRWAPAMMFARDAVGRELFAVFGLEGVKPHSCSIEVA